MNNFKILPLLILVAMLSFSVRLFDVVTGVSSMSGSVHAASSEEMEVSDEQPPPMDGDEPASEAPAEAPPADGGITFSDADAGDGSEWRDPVAEDPAYEAVKMEVFQDLAERRKELEAKEREFVTREALLKAAEQELDRKYQELNQLRGELEELLQEQSDEEKARIDSLVKIYEGMKPKDAARIFDTLDLDILTSVVSKMSERKLSPILAAMNPERARTLTILLAEQKTLPSLPQSN